MKLFFCKDGILRLYSNEHTPLIPCTFIQEEMDLIDEDFMFFSRFLNKEATFEKGLTFQAFLRCLAPWADFWSIYSQVDISAYLDYVNRPHLHTTKAYIDNVEFSTFVSVESGLSYLIDGKMVRAEDVGFLHDNFAEKFDPTLVLGASFNIENLFYLRGYNNSIVHFSFDITHTPFYEYMYAPLTLRKINNIMFSEDGAKSLMELKGKAPKNQPKSETLVFAKNFPGKQRIISGDEFEDESYSYVEGEHIFSLEELMREMFRHMPTEPLTMPNPYSNIIHKSFEINKDFEGKISKEELSYQIGQTIEDMIDQEYEKIPKYNTDGQENEEKEDQQTESQNKILNLHPQNVDKEKSEKLFNKTSNKENKVLNLQEFREKKDKELHSIQAAQGEIAEEINEDQQVIIHMVEEARMQNIPLMDAFSIEQNYQTENRVMGILQPVLFETFDPLSFIENMEDKK